MSLWLQAVLQALEVGEYERVRLTLLPKAPVPLPACLARELGFGARHCVDYTRDRLYPIRFIWFRNAHERRLFGTADVSRAEAYPVQVLEGWQRAITDEQFRAKREAEGTRFNFAVKAIQLEVGWIYIGDTFVEDFAEIEAAVSPIPELAASGLDDHCHPPPSDLSGGVNVGDALTLRDMIRAWRAALGAGGADPHATERNHIAQASFGVDLAGDPPALARTWTPNWVRDPVAFAADRLENRGSLARIARMWAALPADADPLAGIPEMPRVVLSMWEQHVSDRPTLDMDALLTDLVGTLWNIDPTDTVRVSTAALHRVGPAARILETQPDDDTPIACPQCGWTGVVRDASWEMFSEVMHWECPRCAKILLIRSAFSD